MKVAYITDDVYLKHDTGSMHPESAQRLRSINKAIDPLYDSLIIRSPIRASERIIGYVHTPEHIEMIKNVSRYGGSIDSDTVCSVDSYDAATMAVGAGIVALDGI